MVRWWATRPRRREEPFLLRTFHRFLVFFALGCESGSAPAQAPGSVPVAPDAALTSARTALNRGRWGEAESVLRKYLGSHPASAEAEYLLAATLFHENHPRESLDTYTRAAKLVPPSPADLRQVALDYVLLGDYEDADRWATRSLQEAPTDGETWYVMGRIRQTDNRFADAVSCFTKALQFQPHSVKAENNLGLAYEGLNRPEDAAAAYRQAIAWQENQPHPSEQPFLNLGILLTDQNKLDEALGMLKRAEMLAPKDPKIHASLGKLYVRQSAYAAAQTEFEQAVAGDPNNAGLHFQLGQVYRHLNLPQRANEELEHAAALEAQGRH